jgi:hypothetical protein
VGPVLKSVDGANWFAETVNWDSTNPQDVRKIGVAKASIAHNAARGQTWAIGQLYGVLATGLISVQHVFEGLRRPMSVNGDMAADEKKLVLTWAAQRDAQISREGLLTFCAAPLDTVFFVIVSPNTMADRFPEMFGWAERWGWIDRHQSLRGAPRDFETRYDTRLWSNQ